jgi:hypothetical protein
VQTSEDVHARLTDAIRDRLKIDVVVVPRSGKQNEKKQP